MALIAHKTKLGATRQSVGMIEGYGLKYVAFELGKGGHNNLNGNPLTVDRNITSLPAKVFGPSDNVTNSLVDSSSIQVACRLEAGEAAGLEFSNLGIIAEIVAPGRAENGLRFLYAVANFSLTPRLPGVMTFKITIRN